MFVSKDAVFWVGGRSMSAAAITTMFHIIKEGECRFTCSMGCRGRMVVGDTPEATRGEKK